MATGTAINPIEQFGIVQYVPIHLFGKDFSFTNSAAYMLLSVAPISLVMIVGSRHRALVPGRLQGIAETAHDFVADMLKSTTGKEGRRFFPFVFCLFMFILFANVISLVPHTFSVTGADHHHGRDVADGVLPRHHLRHRQERRALLQAVRAARRADLYPAAGRRD